MNEICLCAVCMTMLYEGDKMKEHIKYEFDGEVDYIELAHEGCGSKDNLESGKEYWV